MQRVERPDVVDVGVRDGDPDDRRPDRPGLREDPGVGAGQRGVDEREPVVLPDEVGVRDPEVDELDEVVAVVDASHRAGLPGARPLYGHVARTAATKRSAASTAARASSGATATAS